MQEKELELLVKKVLENMGTLVSAPVSSGSSSAKKESQPSVDVSDIEDLGEMDFRKEMRVPNPANRDAFMKMKQSTPGRIGIWRAGPRYTTRTMLRFRADHATAQDAVFQDVPEEFIKQSGWFEVQSQCADRDIFLTRPDLGRKLSDEARKTLAEKCQKNPKVEIYISDGLSSTAVMVNAQTTLDAITHGLKNYSISIGTPFFLKYGRVAAMEDVGEITGADVVAVLIGERPGLITAESMSCYMAYKPTVGMPESNRTVVSNIHSGGMPAVEAGAYIADIVKKMLDQKASGLNLK